MLQDAHQKFIDQSLTILKADSRILGLAIAGSYLEQRMDEYSDLDLVIVSSDQSFSEVMNDRDRIANRFGPLLAHFTGEHVGEPRLLICLYANPLLHVDLKFVSLTDFKIRIENPTVLWERQQELGEVISKTEAHHPLPDLQWIEDRFWVWIHYAAQKLGRGELFETIDFLSFLRGEVLGPLALVKKGKLPRGVRKLEFHIPEAVESFKATIPSYQALSCFNALNAAINLYQSLRQDLAKKGFNRRQEAEDAAINYLQKIGKNL